MNTARTSRKEVGISKKKCIWGELAGVEKIKVLDGGRKEMVVNSCFKDLEGGMGLKGVGEFAPEAGEKGNERVKVSRDPGFWQFNHKRVAGRSCAT